MRVLTELIGAGILLGLVYLGIGHVIALIETSKKDGKNEPGK